jgi:hypothetical protein
VDDAIETVRQQVGSGKVLLGLSGGVDSSVVAALLHRAIGDQLVCVFVDNGLLRLKEGDEVMEAFRQAADDSLALNIIRVDAEEEFLGKLAGESDPERKRKIIGETFIEVFEREAAKLEGVAYLAQGTIYPDVIESAASKFGKALCGTPQPSRKKAPRKGLQHLRSRPCLEPTRPETPPRAGEGAVRQGCFSLSLGLEHRGKISELGEIREAVRRAKAGEGEAPKVERLMANFGRIRDVVIGPAGEIYLAVEHRDNGSLWRLVGV